jgi:hypothetical protein
MAASVFLLLGTGVKHQMTGCPPILLHVAEMFCNVLTDLLLGWVYE